MREFGEVRLMLALLFTFPCTLAAELSDKLNWPRLLKFPSTQTEELSVIVIFALLSISPSMIAEEFAEMLRLPWLLKSPPMIANEACETENEALSATFDWIVTTVFDALKEIESCVVV